MQLTVSGRGTESFHSCPARRVLLSGDSATLKSDLAGLPAGTELVLVGTTQNNNADASLDTTSIGGTNYSSYSAAWQPQGYAAIGVSGATAGSAYENYYLSGDLGKAYQQNSFANGILAKDGSGNYNFHAANNVQFEVYPNNPTFSTSTVSISYNTGSTLTLLLRLAPRMAFGSWSWIE